MFPCPGMLVTASLLWCLFMGVSSRRPNCRGLRHRRKGLETQPGVTAAPDRGSAFVLSICEHTGFQYVKSPPGCACGSKFQRAKRCLRHCCSGDNAWCHEVMPDALPLQVSRCGEANPAATSRWCACPRWAPACFSRCRPTASAWWRCATRRRARRCRSSAMRRSWRRQRRDGQPNDVQTQ